MRTSACLLSLVLGFPLAAQVRDNVTVELIEVPVYVSTATGQAIRGLTKDSFDLRVDGRSQPIEYFEAIDFGSRRTAETEKAGPPASRERRLYLLLFDANYTIPAKLDRARRAAEYALEHSNPATDLFAVATHTSTKGIQFATPFVSDRAAIRRALHTLTVTSSHDPLGLAMTAAERTAFMEMPADTMVYSLAESEMADALRGGAAFQDLVMDATRHRVIDIMRDYADLAGRLSGLPGQKHVLLFSSTFPSTPIHGGASPVPSSPTSGGGIDAEAMDAFKNVCRAFAKAGVFVDAVDIEGIRHQQGRIEPFNSDDGLHMVALGTGGTYIHARNDFGPAVNEVLDSQRLVYVLAFNRRDNRPGTIRVRVNGIPRGSRVSYRQGFGKGAPSKDVDPLQLADILLHDVPQTGLSLALKASKSRLEISVPREEIVAQTAADSAVDTLIYVFDDSGSAVFGGAGRLDLSGNQAILTSGEDVNLPPGHYVAKAIARIAGTASLGFARTEFTVQ